MKVCVLVCKSDFLTDPYVFPPLGLIAVATSLHMQGHTVRIQEEVTSERFDYYLLGPTTPEYPSALRLLDRTKGRTVIGGPHATFNSAECLEDGFDVVAIGDGENLVLENLPDRGLIDLGGKDLSAYNLPNRELLDIYKYRYLINDRPATTMLTSRGCPYHCGFCAKSDSRVRYRTVSNIEEETKYLTGLGFRALMLFDDTFIVKRDRAVEISRMFNRYAILWRCFVRGDLVVKHGRYLTETMANCGCVEVGIGIESGSEQILRTVGKGESTDTIRQAISLLRSSGIRVKGFFIVGLPGESPDTLEETRQFIREVSLNDADFTVYQPYRGSPIWNHREEYDIDWDDVPPAHYKGYPGSYRCAVRTSSLTSEQILKARDELEGAFKNGRIHNEPPR